jgi:DDE domain
VYRAVDQYGQVVDVLIATRRDAKAARKFFRRAMSTLKVTPTEVVTDAAAVYPAVFDELVPSAVSAVLAGNSVRISPADRVPLRCCPLRVARAGCHLRACLEVGYSHSLMAVMWRVASYRTASLSYRVATARLRLRRLIPHSTAWRCL